MNQSTFPESPYKPMLKSALSIISALVMVIVISLGIIAGLVYANPYC